MKKNAKVIGILVCTLLITSSIIITADWAPGDGHKMHYPQLPDEAGWDVYATAGLSDYGYQDICLADDWSCSESGPVTDIHFWGSWKGGIEGNILSFSIAIHDDIPADQSPTGYSMPGATLWEETFTSWTAVPIDPPSMEGWYNPSSGEIIYDDHDNYFQYNIVDIISPFYQVQGTIYWLCISAIVEYDPSGVQPLWGWKSSLDHWNDDACWAEWGVLDWIDLWEPSLPVTNQYWIAIDPAGNPDPTFTGGTDYYDDGTSLNGWYYYPATDWWNIWFYDHPFDYDRIKEIFTSFFIYKYDSGQPSYVEVAINWATELWPPDLPPPIPPDDEPFIAREIFLIGQDIEGFYEYFTTILDYNPEWVSIDVRGFNFVIENGIIEHTCLGSLDLAFVITGGDQPGPEIEYSKTVWNESLQVWDEYIEAEVCTIARFNLSIYNNDTDSAIVTKIWDTLPPCLEYADSATVNGFPQEPDVINLPNIEWNYVLPADYWWPGSAPNELPPDKWIFIEFDVHVIGPPCIDNINWGYWDISYDGDFYFFEDNAIIHPISGEPWPNHKMHFPQLPDPNGWDVLANFEMPFLPLADDWMCSETGPVTDIHFWGSWLWDFEGVIDGFDIYIFDDIPAVDSPTGYSMPGTMLWNEYFSTYDIIPMDPSPQGWYDPLSGWFEPPGNHFNYYQYNIESISDPFTQVNGTIYWLVIHPNVVPPMYPDPPLWGWKTSLEHWNDDAVYWDETSPHGWMELYDPITGLSLDLAFVITGEEEPCNPSIDVEKYVWDEDNADWVDADTAADALDIPEGTDAEFLIAIHNDGDCCDLYPINVYDFLEDSMEFIDAYPPPDLEIPVADGIELYWFDLGPLSPCNWINITVYATVLGPACNTDFNYVEVEGYCEDTNEYVYDWDYAYVHAIELFEAEFGDAPEDAIAYPSTSTIGFFPTCMCCGPVGWVQHDSYLGGGLFFGNMKDNEIDGNAGWCTIGGFPPYDQDEGFFGGPDGGLMWPDPYTIDSTMNVVPLAGIGTPLGYIGQTANWGVEIDMFVQNWLPIDAYVNVLADWNQNGQWGDPGEHILIDFTIPAMWNGPISLLGPPSFTIGPNHGYIWARFTVSEYPVSLVYPIPWNGDGYFEDGETEDYLLRIDEGLPIASFDYEPLNPTTVDTVYFNSTSYDTNPGGSITNWTWNIGGTPKYGEFVTHQFTSDGTYVVTLTVTDNDGNVDSTAKLVPVGDIEEITNMSKGWNIVSPPFNQSVSKTNLIIKYGGYYYSWSQATTSGNPTGSPIINGFVFGWQRTTPQMYIFASSLDPGYGYWVYSYQNNVELWAINITAASDNYITPVKTGWNLVGLPDDSSVSKTNLIVNYGGTDYSWSTAVSNGYVSDFIFGWQRTTPQMYIFASSLDPGYGYWIYAYFDCILKKI